MERIVEHEIERKLDVPQHQPHRRRRDAERHLDGERRRNGVHAAAHTTDATRDEHRIAWIAALQNDLVAAEETRDRIRLVHLAFVKIDDRVKRERARDSGYRIDVEVADLRVALDELVDLRAIDRDRRVCVRVGATEETWRAIRVELDGKVLKAHR